MITVNFTTEVQLNYIKGTSRKHMFFFQECIDEIIEEDNFVRFLDAYFYSFNMIGLGFEMPRGNTGTSPYRHQLKL